MVPAEDGSEKRLSGSPHHPLGQSLRKSRGLGMSSHGGQGTSHWHWRSVLRRALGETSGGFHGTWQWSGKTFFPLALLFSNGRLLGTRARDGCHCGVISRQCLLSTTSEFLWEVCAIRNRSYNSSGLSAPLITCCAKILSPGSAGDMACRDVNNLWPELATVVCPGAAEPHPGVLGCFDVSDFTPLQRGC